MITGYFKDYLGTPICNANKIRYIFNDEGKPLQEILDSISYVSDIERVNGVKNLPIVGNEDHLYVDLENKNIYLWSKADSLYLKIDGIDNSIIENSHGHQNMEILNNIKYALTEELKGHYDSAVQNIYVGETKQKKVGNEIHIPAITGAASTVVENNLESNKVLISDTSGKLAISSITTTELNALSGLTQNVQNTLDNTKNDLVAESNRAIGEEERLANELSAEVTRASEQEQNIQNVIDSNRIIWDDKYTRNEIDNRFSSIETSIDWKESVETYTDIEVVYPDPEDGWTVNVKDTDYTYRFNGTEWVAISANSIPKATQEVDGLLSKEDKISYDDANIKKHEHSNKTLLDKITQLLVDNWNAAFSHLSNKNNPHEVSKIQVGLENVDNTSDENKPISIAQQVALDLKVDKASLDNKVDKIDGMGLSSNDFTDEEKEKLLNIKDDANPNVQADWNITDETNDAFIKNKPDKLSQFTNDLSGYKRFTYVATEPTTIGENEIVFVYE